MKRVFVLIWLSLAAPLCAQESNYWTHAIGTRSALMGGAVVGGVRDNSALFYNPGALGFITNPSLSISANAYQLAQLRVENGAGTGNDLESNQIQLLPLLIGGVRRFEKLPRVTLAYGILSRTLSTTSASDRREAILRNVFTVPADSSQEYIAYTRISGLHRELWGGVSGAYQLGRRFNERLSIGLGSFVAVRMVNTSYEASATALPTPPPPGVDSRGASVLAREAIDLIHFRLIFKLGVAYELKGWKLGLAITAPSISLGGSATVDRVFGFNGLHQSIPNPLKSAFEDVTATGRQEELSPTWKSPLSIAFGLEKTFKKTTIGLSLEWFDKVKTYDVVNPEARAFLRPSTVSYPLSAADFLRIKQQNKSVMNWGIGIEQMLSEKWIVYASYRSDYSYFERAGRQGTGLAGPTVGATANLNIARLGLDLHHLVAGVTVRGQRSDISAGFHWGFGSRGNISQLVNMSNPRDVTLLFSERLPTDASFNSYGLILGFTTRLK